MHPSSPQGPLHLPARRSVIADFEERYVRTLMKAHQGNVSAAARVAGIDRMSLHKVIERYGLDARELGRG